VTSAKTKLKMTKKTWSGKKEKGEQRKKVAQEEQEIEICGINTFQGGEGLQ